MSKLHFAAVVVVPMVVLSACADDQNAPDARLNRANLGVERYGVDGPGTVGDFKSGAGDIVYFSTDSSDLSPEARQTLTAQATWLQRYRNHSITIEGHADERGTREYNIALGAKRAAAVKSFLTSHGINQEQIRTVSYGKERPVAICNDISCWSQNRRAQTVLQSTERTSWAQQ